jgi:hypothetical protein
MITHMKIDLPEIWNESNEEMPPQDGFYLVCNNPLSNEAFGKQIMYYDGYGFKEGDIYKRPLFWSLVKQLEKRYGKLN